MLVRLWSANLGGWDGMPEDCWGLSQVRSLWAYTVVGWCEPVGSAEGR